MADDGQSPPADGGREHAAIAPDWSWHGVLPTAAFYLAWGGLALLSHLAGRTTLAPTAAALLLGAILVTNLLLALLNAPAARAGVDAAIATGQAGLAIAWTTVYAVLAEGPGELVPGMYLTAVLVAFTRAPSERLQQLALAAGGGYAMSVVVRLLAGGAVDGLWGELLQCAGVIGMLFILVRRARQLELGQLELAAQVNRLQQEVRRVSRNAERDHLTKSFSRQYIMEALLREKARADRTGRGFSICIFDLDRFKSLNDSHGHVVGDRVLAVFAERARRALRAMDSINPTRYRRALGRLGGEEFVAVLPGTDVAGALRCAERVREAVARHPVGSTLSITVSAGVAEYRPGESIPELLTRADQAMYAAKRSGRNRVRVSAVRPPKDQPGGPSRPNLRVVR
ncbi:MAG: GGDEF domain-containing protein [Gammaproteobacteria bacterium]|nr:MAG: GGDEF domain-containing protein [Gammaproteobacteria bacterium]